MRSVRPAFFQLLTLLPPDLPRTSSPHLPPQVIPAFQLLIMTISNAAEQLFYYLFVTPL